MKIIHQSDIHLRSTVPINRVDDYYNTQVMKFTQLLDFAEHYEADVLCGGDLLDIPSTKFDIYNAAQGLLRKFSRKFYTCVGQHEIYYHNFETLENTALWGLHSCGALEIVRGVKTLANEVVLHGVAWEQTPTAPIEGRFNIFLGHVSVFKKVPFYWKGEGYTPKTLKEKYPGYQLYLCGDIHSPLVKDNVVVSGPMMRMSINHIDYRPRCYLIDTDTMEITPLYYKIEKDVFNVPDEKIESTLNLDNLIGAMKSSAVGKESYKRDCYALAGEDEEVKEILGEIFNELS
jgi:DNA repair exonuclease SbcCD nuclease subunit